MASRKISLVRCGSNNCLKDKCHELNSNNFNLLDLSQNKVSSYDRNDLNIILRKTQSCSCSLQKLTNIIFAEGNLFLHSGEREFCDNCSEASTHTELIQNKTFLSLCIGFFSEKIRIKPWTSINWIFVLTKIPAQVSSLLYLIYWRFSRVP